MRNNKPNSAQLPLAKKTRRSFRKSIQFAKGSGKPVVAAPFPARVTEMLTAQSPPPGQEKGSICFEPPASCAPGRNGHRPGRSPDIGMAQHLAQALDVHTLLHAARRIGVPQHMEISIRDPRRLQQCAVLVLQCPRFQRSRLTGQKIVLLIPGRANRLP